jgi:WD40 repeat protein
MPLGFNDNGRVLILNNKKDNRITLRDLKTGKEKRSFATMPRDKSRSFALSPNGSTVLFGTEGTSARSWDVATGKENLPLGGHKEQAFRAAFSGDSKMVATGGGDPFIQIWDWPEGKLRTRIDVGKMAEEIDFTPDGKLVVRLWYERMLRFFDPHTGKEEPPLGNGHRGRVETVVFTPEGKSVVSGSTDGTVRLWNRVTGKEGHQITATYARGPLALSPDGKTLAAGSINDRSIRLWDLVTLKELPPLAIPTSGVARMTFTADSRFLLETGAGGGPGKDLSLCLWDWSKGKEIRRFDCSFPFALSPDGKMLAGRVNDSLCLFEMATGRQLRVLDPNHGYAEIAFTPDGRCLVAPLAPKGSKGDAGGYSLWEIATGRERLPLEDQSFSAYNAPAVSPDGRLFAVGTLSGGVQLWDLASGKRLAPLQGHESVVLTLAFAGDSRALVSGSSDTTLLIWDISSRVERITPAELTTDQAKRLWEDLADEDAIKAYQAILTLAATPRVSLVMIKAHLHPAILPVSPEVARLLADLDSDQFDKREKADKALEELGDLVEPALLEALKNQPSPEMKRRLEKLLDKPWPPGFLRKWRALEVVERIGTTEVQELLKHLSEGAPSARLTREARASLDRLVRKAK